MTSRPYLKVPTGNDHEGSRHDSFELDSLASSEEFSDHTPSSRGLSPLGSPIGHDSDRESLMDEQDYLNPGYAGRSRTNSGSTLGDIMFSLPATRDRRANIEVPLEKQKRLSLFNGLSLVIGLQIGLVAPFNYMNTLTYSIDLESSHPLRKLI